MDEQREFLHGEYIGGSHDQEVWTRRRSNRSRMKIQWQVRGRPLPITDEQWSDLVINQGRRKFIDGNVVEYDPPVVVVVPASVSSRQFKLQLLATGLLDQMDAWVSSQSKAVQIPYEYSGSFGRTEPMMALTLRSWALPISRSTTSLWLRRSCKAKKIAGHDLPKFHG